MAQTVILLVLIGAPCHLSLLVDWEISTMEFVLVTLGLLAVGAGIVGNTGLVIIPAPSQIKF